MNILLSFSSFFKSLWIPNKQEGGVEANPDPLVLRELSREPTIVFVVRNCVELFFHLL